ncbi:protein ultrapetala 2, partial [Phtheirospermum japonicum]
SGRSLLHTNWKSQIWVFSRDGQKLALRRTCLLKHHTEAFQRPLRQVIHRDEFKCCSRCNKDRRFSLRNKEACRIYHDALLDTHWKCPDMPNQP